MTANFAFYLPGNSLDRMVDLSDMIRMRLRRDDPIHDDLDAEYDRLKGTVMDAYEGILPQLAKVDFFTVHIRLTPEVIQAVNSGQYGTLTFYVKDGYLSNDSMRLVADDESFGGERKN